MKKFLIVLAVILCVVALVCLVAFVMSRVDDITFCEEIKNWGIWIKDLFVNPEVAPELAPEIEAIA